MTKIITLFILLCASTFVAAQENQTLYLLFEFMQVDDDQRSSYGEVEDFWAEIHKQRVADGNIIGWDLWELTPGGSEQGSQYMTTALYTSLEKMLTGIPNGKFEEYLKKAHPSLSKKEIEAMMKLTVQSRDMAHLVYAKQINSVGSTNGMKEGIYMKFDVMKQTDSSYPVMEDQIFKPWHQQEVDEGKKMNWGLIEVILPQGSAAFGSHITYSMYNNIKQLATSMESWGGEMDLKTELSVQDGLKTRDWREVKVARLVKMIR